jgi:hypothetical protein
MKPKGKREIPQIDFEKIWALDRRWTSVRLAEELVRDGVVVATQRPEGQ